MVSLANLRSIKLVAAGLYMAVAAIGLTASPAHALLIEGDLNAVGDKLITLDTVTGLEWLDVTATLALSYDAAELTPFVTSQGFRHADLTEVSTLYTNAGVTDQTGVFAATNFLGAQELLSKLGCTFACAWAPFLEGWADLVPFHVSSPADPFLMIDLGTSTAGVFGFFPWGAKDTGNSVVGNYLVRAAPVTEPSSMALLVGGLIAVAGFRRRRLNA